MQRSDEFKWAQEKYGWESEQKSDSKNNGVKKKVRIPYFIVAKKIKEVTEKGVGVLAQNFARSKALDEEDKKSGRKSGGYSLLFLGIGIVFFLFAISGGTLTAFMLSSMISSSSPFSASGVVSQLEQEVTIVDAAKNELSHSSENIGGQKYKDWYGTDGNWCAMFVSYCADMCGYLDEGIMPKSESVSNMADWYKGKGLWKDAGSYIPKPGDIVFFQNNMSHVGIVIEYDSSIKMIKTIEGNTGAVNTTINQPHAWKIDDCKICEGDHLVSEENLCETCSGKGYILTKSGISNVYGNNSSIMKYTGCASCGGRGEKTEYFNAYGCAWIDGSLILGSGKTGFIIVCQSCYNQSELFGKSSYCTNEGCEYNSYGAWEDYPDGICYTTTIEYHEGSAVHEKSYPVSYENISGYGIPLYPLVLSENENN